MRIIICGCKGKMGQAVAKAADDFNDIQIVAGIDVTQDFSGSYPIYSKFSDIEQKADVIIDFSNPALIGSILEYAKSSRTAAVICTTGFSENQVNMIKDASRYVPILYSRNMSLGVNLLVELSKIASKVLGDKFDIEIVEKHHNQKIDAPSGTALMLAEEISDVMTDSPELVYNRTTKKSRRTPNEIGIHSIRGGTIAGDHDVIFAGNKEMITLSHHAESREIFAVGALRAAKFLVSQNAGFYTMKNVIKNF